MVAISKSLIALVAVISAQATALPTADHDTRGLGSLAKGPLALVGGPEGLALDLILETKPGQEAEAWIEQKASAVASPVVDWAEGEAKKEGKSLLQYVTEVAQRYGAGGSSSDKAGTNSERRGLVSALGKGPLALLGGPEGIAISLLLDTKPGQEAQAWLVQEAEKAGESAVDYLKGEAKKDGKSPKQYFTELVQKFT